MHRFLLLLFILGFGHSIYAASIFQFPDLTRRLPERTTSPGCAYKGERYEHGERVPTAEPCLNCTCSRAVLVCYLRVCPTASAPPPGCFAAREVGECCPSLVCGGADLSRPSNKSDSNQDLRPTFQPVREETTVADSSTDESYPTDTSAPVYDSHPTDTSAPVYDSHPTDTSAPVYDSHLETIQTASVSEADASTVDDSLFDTTQTYHSSPTDAHSSVSENAFHTTLTEDDSLVYITSTQEPTHDYDINFFNDIPGGCMVNGTLYGDGSAMLSSSFCEYCFCIRGKSTCLKPKCHLSIDGCVPHYDNHYSCCPSRYDCSQRTSSAETTAPTRTTTISTTLPETTQYFDGPSDCIVDGAIYHEGDVVPDRLACHNCYCSDSSIVCEKIKCSPPLEGCQPIIPEGHCCPISYRCDYQRPHSASNTIKGANLNDSASVDSKGTDIKSVKNYFNPNNAEVRVKTANDRESIALLQNVIPIHRRLDENVVYEQNSTIKDIDEGSPVYIGNRASTKPDIDIAIISDQIRENDKTLNLELNHTTVASYSPEQRTFDDNTQISDRTTTPQDKISRFEPVSVGFPEIHTFSIQELFDQFFSRHQINSSKIPSEMSSEPKRNNSKQPSSIVEIYDSETDIPASTTTKVTTTKLLTTPEISKDTTNTEMRNLQTDIFTTGYSTPVNTTDSVSEYSTEPTTINLNQDTSYSNQEKIGNEAVSSIFPNTETQSDEEFHSRTDAEFTHPMFIRTKQKDNEEFQDKIIAHSTLPAFTTSDEFNNEDLLESSPSSHLITTISDLLNIKFGTQPPIPSIFSLANTGDVHSEEPKHTQFTSPAYTTTKKGLIEELKVQTETRPVVFIYDTTRNLYTEKPKTPIPTETTVSLHGTSKHPFSDELKRYTETQPTSAWYGTTKELFDKDSVKQTGMHSTSPVYITTKKSFNEFEESEHLSTSPENTSIRNLHIEEQTETPSFTAHSSLTTKNVNNDDQTEIHSFSEHVSTTTRNMNDEVQTKTQNIIEYRPMQTEYQELPTSSAFSTYINTDNVNNYYFNTQTDSQSSSPMFTTSKNTDNVNFSKDIEKQQTLPTFFSTTYQNDDSPQENTETNPTTTAALTTKISDEDYSKTGEIQTSIFSSTTKKLEKEDHHPTTLSTTQISEQNDSATTESTKVSTRINSKLPSFNYIEISKEKNNTVIYPRYPVLSDTIRNNLPAESRNNTSGEDFTNIGSIYLAAPLSVGGTDSRKDIDQKPKITQSGGVIFMDPKYTDINTKTNFESREQPQKSIESIDTRQQTSSEKTDKDSSNNERKKGPRIQDSSNQSSASQVYKIIPFVAEDAIRGQFGKINNTLVVQAGSTEGLPDMVSDFCFIKGRIYMNGEMIGKPDPCELCRCFYGRELCQIQRCPTPPDCIPEKVPGFCCPRFTCGNNATSGEQVNREIKPISHVHLSQVVTSTTKRPDIIERNPPTNDKQEVKFGIRVRARPTTSSPVRTTEHTTERKILTEKTTTVKPEIRTHAHKQSITTTTTTSRKPHVVRPITSKKPEVKRTTTTTTTQSPIFPDPWGLLKVSGCNIYGKFFNINDQVEILSGPCSHCICTTNGVECNDIC